MNAKKFSIMFLVSGLVYLTAELTTRAIRGDIVGCEVFGNVLKPLSLTGQTSLWMILIAGACASFAGNMRYMPGIKRLPMIGKMLLAGLVTIAIELVSGIILNVWLELNIWDYTHKPYNFMSQIALKNSIIYIIMSPSVIWGYDMLRYLVFRDVEKYSVFSLYKKVITLK